MMQFRFKGERDACKQYLLTDRDVLVMRDSTQEVLEHRLVRDERKKDVKYNLTFRHIRVRKREDRERKKREHIQIDDDDKEGSWPHDDDVQMRASSKDREDERLKERKKNERKK